jgi:hypothetical protein
MYGPTRIAHLKDAATMTLYDAFDAELFAKPYAPSPFVVSLNTESHCKENLHQSGITYRADGLRSRANCYNDQ